MNGLKNSTELRLGIDASNLRGGGGITHLAEVIRAAEPAEFGFGRVLVWGGKETLDAIPERPWLERIHVPALDGSLPARLFWRKKELPGLAEKACDLLFIPGGGSAGGGKPTVTMSRNMLPFEFTEMARYGGSWMFLRLLLLRYQQTASFRSADGVIFLTEYARNRVAERTGKLKGRLAGIPHGVDERFRRAVPRQRPIQSYNAENPFRLLYVSIVDVYKHQWYLVEAVAMLRREGLPVALDLVGPAYPPALRRLREMVRRMDPGEEFVRYRGSVNYRSLPECYHQADAFVFASSCENMPNILLEAMASSLPIACARRGPMPEILGDAGLYFDPEKPSDIAGALRELISDESLRGRLASLASQRAELYSWKRCARDTFAFLAEVATSRNGSH